jgi:hypothetical protein
VEEILQCPEFWKVMGDPVNRDRGLRCNRDSQSPERLNALSPPMLAEQTEFWPIFEADPSAASSRASRAQLPDGHEDHSGGLTTDQRAARLD